MLAIGNVVDFKILQIGSSQFRSGKPVMKRPVYGLFGAVLVVILSLPGLGHASTSQTLEALRVEDLRLATTAQRLQVANVALCDRRSPATGLVLHSIAQYAPDVRAAARNVFGFERPVSVEGVVAGSPAQVAGVKPGDGIEVIDGKPVVAGPLSETPSSALRDAVYRRLAALPANKPIELRVRRAGRDLTLTIEPVPECRSQSEVLLRKGFIAHSDGKDIQISLPVLLALDDRGLAVIVAHELAHTVLHHRARLEAAGVHQGLLGEFGQSLRLTREAEKRADLLSIHLLRNAGYDPQIAPDFWRGPGRRMWGGLMRSRTHPSARDRAAAMEREISLLPPASAGVDVPGMVATREKPMR